METGPQAHHHSFAKVAVIVLVLLAGVVVYLLIIDAQSTHQPVMPNLTWNAAKYQSPKNPYLHYEKAGQLLSSIDVEVLTNRNKKPTPEERDRALNNLRFSIDEFMRGAACSPKDFEFPYKVPSSQTMFSEFEDLSSLARVIVLDADAKIENGKVGEGIQELLAVQTMGNEISSAGTMLGALVSYAIEGISERRVQTIFCDPQLTSAHFHAIAKGLEKLDKEKKPFHDILQDEYQFSRGSMLEIMDYSIKDINQILGREAAVYLAIPGMKARSIHNFDKAWQAMLAASEKPYYLASSFDPEAMIPRTDIINQLFMPHFKTARQKDITVVTITRGHMLMAALEAYRLEKGAYPQTLKALVTGGYLSAVPADPFADNKPFIYQHLANQYLLYSIGPNMKDDRGHLRSVARIYDMQPGDLVFDPQVDIWKLRN
jgi:hypothetical protein